MRKRAVLLFVTTGLLVAMAQRTIASLRGTMTDSTHAIVPGASGTVANQDTGLTRTVATNAERL